LFIFFEILPTCLYFPKLPTATLPTANYSIHSLLKLSTGLAIAALIALEPTVKNAISNEEKMATAKISEPKSMRYAKWWPLGASTTDVVTC
jgi:hypothetical protein